MSKKILFLFGSALATLPAAQASDFCKGPEMRNGQPISALKTFADGYAQRRFGKTDAERSEGELRIAKALYSADFVHPAEAAFSAILRTAQRESAKTALLCLTEIHRNFPTLSLSGSLIPRIADAARSSDADSRNAARQLILGVLLKQTKAGEKTDRSVLLSLINDDPILSAYAESWLSARTHNVSEILKSTERFLQLTSAQGEAWSTERAQLSLLRSRALYGAKRYEEAAQELKRLDKKSNQTPEALTALAWSWLQAEKHHDAIGVASSLRTGALRNTFAPEAWMILAISFNELCQYPLAVASISRFRKNYETSHQWLSEWEKNESPLYSKAVAFLKSGDTRIAPRVIAGEWLKSPVFQANQSEINSLINEADLLRAYRQKGQTEQLDLGKKVLLQASLTEKTLGTELAPEALKKLRQDLQEYRRFRDAAPLWRKLTQNFERRIPARKSVLVQEIHRDLRERTLTLSIVLAEVAENLERVEAEIFGGASEDIVWRNANPDYKEEQSEAAANSAHVWKWGKANSGEIWEDEVDSFRADLADHCVDREKHLEKIRRKI